MYKLKYFSQIQPTVFFVSVHPPVSPSVRL